MEHWFGDLVDGCSFAYAVIEVTTKAHTTTAKVITYWLIFLYLMPPAVSYRLNLLALSIENKAVRRDKRAKMCAAISICICMAMNWFTIATMGTELKVFEKVTMFIVTFSWSTRSTHPHEALALGESLH